MLKKMVAERVAAAEKETRAKVMAECAAEAERAAAAKDKRTAVPHVRTEPGPEPKAKPPSTDFGRDHTSRAAGGGRGYDLDCGGTGEGSSGGGAGSEGNSSAVTPQSPHLVVNRIVVGAVHLALIGCCQKILLHLL